MPKPQLTRDDVKFWISEIKACEERQKKELMARNHYPMLIQYYEGQQSGKEETPIAGDSVKKLAVINEYFPNTNSLIAEIMYQNPEITTEARRPEAPSPVPGQLPINVEENEPTMSSALKYGFDKLEALNENRLALFDMIYAGYSAVEVNHFFSREPVTPKECEAKLNLAQTIMSKFKAEDELAENLPPVEQSKTKDESYMHRWNPLDILLDYKANRLKELRYIVKKIRLSHSEFKAKYPQFANLVRATQSIEWANHEQEEHRKAVLLYEIQQKQKDKYVTFVIASSFDTQELDWYERPYETNGFNIKIGTLHKYGALYPKSYAAVNKSMQDDINNYVTHQMEVAERNVPKRGINTKKVKADGIAALNSTKVMGVVPTDGGAESIYEIPGGRVTIENKELLALFDRHKEKLWSVSEARTGGGSVKPEFAEEIKVQEAGFLARQADIQEGLRQLIREELDTLKDIIVSFWDDAHFFKITGGAKPTWYQPEVRINVNTGQPEVINPLTDILTKDYEVDVDINTALRPNKERKRKEVMEYLTWLAGTAMPILQLHGKMISIEAIEATARDFGLNPKTLLIDMQIPTEQPEEGAPVA